MPSWLEIFVLSVVEGVTEFLPVSSTGHMILAKDLMELPDSAQLNAFLVIVQAGGILAVVTMFWPLLLRWARAWLALLSSPVRVSANARETAHDPSAVDAAANHDLSTLRLQSLSVAVSVLPFAIMGYLNKDIIKSLFSHNVVAAALIVGGVLILVDEFFFEKVRPRKERSFQDMTLPDAIALGVGQCLALWPGFSRSAATILTGRWLGFTRGAAAELSFLIGLPTLVGTAGYEAAKEWHALTDAWMAYVAFGIVVAWGVAYVCVRSFVAFLRRFPLSVFAYYRIAVGALILWYFNFK